MGISSRFDIPIRAAAYRSYVVGFAIPTGVVPHALFWDTEAPYHYLRVVTQADGTEVLLVGGADHRVGQGDGETSWQTLASATPSGGSLICPDQRDTTSPAIGNRSRAHFDRRVAWA